MLLRSTKSTPTIAIVTAYASSKKKEFWSWDSYAAFIPITLKNWRSYAAQHNYDIFTENQQLIDMSRKIGWSKIPVLRHYLQKYDYVFFSDVDFLFTNFSAPLPIDFDKDLVVSHECILGNEWKLMDGTMIMKSSKWSIDFLDKWEEHYNEFKNSINHDQVAFQHITKKRDLRHMKVMPPSEFMTYDTHNCPKPNFGIHFPAGDKYERIKTFIDKHL